MSKYIGVLPLDRRQCKPAADCTCPHQDAREPDHDVACPARLAQQPAAEDWGLKTCYQCNRPVTWLAPDSRCVDCTRLTPDEVGG